MLSMIFGFSGRINRLTWWIIQITIFVIGMIINYVIKDSIPDVQQFKAHPPSLEQSKLLLGALANYALLLISWGVISSWIFISSCVQRLHDKGSAGWRVVFAYVPLGLIFLSGFFLLKLQFIAAGAIIIAAGIGALVSLVWLIVECGMISGEDGENDYGEPIGAASRRDALAAEIAQLSGVAGAQRPQNEFVPVAVQQPALSFNPGNARPSFGKR
jgi:uncharacterized membrane protein YhaH (DUF805 family)